MAYSSQSGTTVSSQLNYLPGQAGYVSQFVAPLQQVLSGNMGASPLYGFAKNQADINQSNMTEQIASTGGLSAPARAKLLQQLASQSASGVQGAVGSSWQAALDTLSKYALAAPTVTTTTSGGGGASVGL